MVSSTSVVQELIPQLATSLGQLRRVPGKNDAWVPQVIALLEKERDPRFERMRRRIGFAQRLGNVAELPERDIELATLGLFFHELLPLKSNGLRAARPWRAYLLRNEDWLRPAFDICEAVRYKDWEEIDAAAEIVAKIAVVYDGRTLDRHERPLAVVDSIMALAEGHAAQRIAELLWTEDGQALCDHHFRRHPRGYRLDAKEIRSGLAKLYRVNPRISAELTIQSMRLPDAAKRDTDPVEVEQTVAQAEVQNGASDNFDRRREALRTRRTEAENIAEETEKYEPDEHSNAAIPTGIEAKLREMESSEQQRDDPLDQELAEPTPRQARAMAADPVRKQQEERMNQLAAISPINQPRNNALDVRDRLQELRIQLGQIQQIAAQAEQLLDGIAPQIDEFAARIADVEAVMDRWSGRPRVAA